MWLITNFGFFSIVRKPGQESAGTLTVRSRVLQDLQMLRERYLPSLGEIESDTGTDYEYRAVAPAAQVASAFCKVVADIDYSNFKSCVADRQGHGRAGVYHGIWHQLWKLTDEEADEPPPAAPGIYSEYDARGERLPRSYGGVVFDERGRVLLRKPAGEFDGYAWTFPKAETTTTSRKYTPLLVKSARTQASRPGATRFTGLVPSAAAQQLASTSS